MGRLVYIAGYGRSGSTILDIILGSHPAVCSVGEVAFLLEEMSLSCRRCACGQPYRTCPFWGDLLDELELRDSPHIVAKRLRRTESRWGLARHVLGVGGTDRDRAYGALQRGIFEYVRRRSGSPVVVDSSKSAGWTAGRPLALERLAGEEVYLLHLVRSGAETTWSVVRHGSNWAAEGRRSPLRLPALRTAIGWTLAHTATRAVGRRLPAERRLRIRYERLVRHPAATLAQIGEWLGLDLEPLARRAAEGGEFPVGHNVGGNRLRQRSAVRLRSPREDEQQSVPPTRLQMLFRAVGGWLERRMGETSW